MKYLIQILSIVIFLGSSCSNEENLKFDYTVDCSIKELGKYDLKDNNTVTFKDSNIEYRKYEILPYKGSGLYYGKGVHPGGVINLREAGVGKHLIVFTPNGQDQWQPFFITIIDSRNTWDKILDN